MTRNIDQIILEAWQHAGIEAEVPGLGMPDLLELADGNLHQDIPTALSNWLAIFDEYGAWFANLAAFLMFSLKLDPSSDIRLRKVLTCIVGNVYAQIFAIRNLVLSGLDVQAKQLLRVLIENIDVALLAAQSEDALSAFELTTDDLASNDFWHKHVSKGKIRATVHSDLRRFLGVDKYRDLEDYIKQEDKILGMSIHPSLGAAQMACLPRIINGCNSDPFTFGFLGGISAFSERTLSYAVFYMNFYVLNGCVPKNIEANKYNNVVQKAIDEFQAHIARGRIALGHISEYAFQNRRSAEFSTRFPDYL